MSDKKFALIGKTPKELEALEKDRKELIKLLEETVTALFTETYLKVILALAQDEVKAVTLIFTKEEDGHVSVQLIPKKPEIEVIGENGQKRIISMFEIKSLEHSKRGDSE